MDAVAELRRDPVSKHQIQPEYGDGQADAGRDCRTRIARPNSQARTGTGKHQLATSRIGNLARLIHNLLYVMTIHTYIQTRGGYLRQRYEGLTKYYNTVLHEYWTFFSCD